MNKVGEDATSLGAIDSGRKPHPIANKKNKPQMVRTVFFLMVSPPVELMDTDNIIIHM
jgi:hypothetical protein